MTNTLRIKHGDFNEVTVYVMPFFHCVIGKGLSEEIISWFVRKLPENQDKDK